MRGALARTVVAVLCIRKDAVQAAEGTKRPTRGQLWRVCWVWW
ncbi:hypothetical protein [Streptomyces noursei]|nr:hypothetical protein [Streptomyces noursei]